MNIITRQSMRLAAPRIAPSFATIRHRRDASSVIGETRVDQTKHNNHPDNDKHDQQMSLGHRGEDGEGRGHDSKQADSSRMTTKSTGNQDGEPEGSDHPAKQPGPEKTPTRSTGIKTDSPHGKAGEGDQSDEVHQQNSERPGPNQVWD